MQKLTSVSLKEAKQSSLALVKVKPTSLWLPVHKALGRVIAKNIICKKDLPAFNNSALDGYAFQSADSHKALIIKGTVFAGDTTHTKLQPGECYKIMTGAKIPDNADTIIGIEDTRVDENNLMSLTKTVKKGNAFRVKGEEVSRGNILLHEGTLLDSSCIALLVSQGISEVEVYRNPTIAIFSTGNELKEPWEEAGEDEIYNVNSSALIALFKEYGFDADYCGVIPDNLEQSKAYFKEMKRYDLLVTTGGISMGEADFVEEALLFNGLKALFHGVNIKPGRPTMIGNMGSTIVASMPGNPLAAFVNAFLFLVPVLKKMQGNKNPGHPTITAQMAEDLKIKPNRSNLILGTYHDGIFSVTMENRYGSGMVSPILQSNALLVTDEQTDKLSQGEYVKIILFKGFF
ncbi:molybdopterin molybdotransferase MoeA [Sulfurospirillum sp. 1612]|uniref:molybdopterin molybdotransferase MoeA n=1 Tax=Sulfurospirillum sp. 1612 TaxID=3094835 RepID=UPI002F91C7D2